MTDARGNESVIHGMDSWLDSSLAPVVVLDPSGPVRASTKAVLCPVLPRALPQSRVYLLNSNIPQRIFEALGVKYATPFGPKMSIQLHVCD